MSKIILPASLNPISRRKDKSIKLSFETRELSAEETMTMLALEGSEGWLCFAPNEAEIEIPTGRVELGEKTPSERLRSVLFVFYKQETDAGRYVGLFDNFKAEWMEKIITSIKNKLEEK